MDGATSRDAAGRAGALPEKQRALPKAPAGAASADPQALAAVEQPHPGTARGGAQTRGNLAPDVARAAALCPRGAAAQVAEACAGTPLRHPAAAASPPSHERSPARRQTERPRVSRGPES